MKHNVLSIAALTLATALTACNSNSKNQTPDGWVIKNEVKEIETIDLEEIAEAIEVQPIVSDEPIGEIRGISGISNDFIACGNRWQLFYHIKDGKLVDKLHAAGNGPNEYSQLLQFSYLPDENLFYGYDNKGQIMCFKTSPFKFETRFPLKTYAHSLFALGHNEMLMTALPPEDELKNVEKEQFGDNSVTVIKDSSVLYRFDGQNLTKLFCIAQGDDGPVFTPTSNSVLMSLMMPKHTIYRYANGQTEKVLTIDYGDMTMPEPEMSVENVNGVMMINMVIKGDYSTGCYHPQLNGSTLAYWHHTVINNNGHNCLAIATPESVRNYEVRIGGLNFEVNIDMVDNGVYTKIIQGDWESKINADEELSKTGKRIIEAMKGNDYNPVILQFKLKTM